MQWQNMAVWEYKQMKTRYNIHPAKIKLYTVVKYYVGTSSEETPPYSSRVTADYLP